MTMTSAAMMPQPPIQPTRVPNALAAQVKVVPQSGIALFSSAYATAMKYIGMKAITMISGAFTPTMPLPLAVVDDVAETGGEAVRRGRGRDPHHNAGEEAERAALEALLAGPASVILRYVDCGHYQPLRGRLPVERLCGGWRPTYGFRRVEARRLRSTCTDPC